MKEQLIANLKRVNWEFEEKDGQVIIKDFFNLHVIISFQEGSYKIDSLLKGWNNLTGVMEYNLKKATNVNYWGYLIATAIIMFDYLNYDGKPLFTGLAYFLILGCILQSKVNLIYWSRYNTISSQIDAWLRSS